MENLKSPFKDIKLKKNGSFFGWGTSPQSDWSVILASATFLALIVTIINAFVFIKVDKGEIFVVEAPEQLGGRTLNLQTLQETVDYYRNKSLELDRIRTSTSTSLVDPSI